MLDSEIITELTQIERIEAAWDALALANRMPMMAPACVLGWWRQLAPANAEPRIVAVRDGEQLVGLAPFYVELGRHGARRGLRLPGIELAGRLAPLAAAGWAPEVSRALAHVLSESGLAPALLTLEGVPADVQLPDGQHVIWTRSLRAGWPGNARPADRRYQVSGCPTVSLQAGSFDNWLEAKSANFRGGMRRLGRRFSEAGGTMRSSTLESLSSDVEVFVRLHASRWKGRGSSKFVRLGERLPAVLNDIGRGLLTHDGRFRLLMLEIEGEPIAAQLFLAAGGRVQYINAGWDERFARFKPPMLGLLSTVEDAFERGEELVDLGPGEQSYKLRFADSIDLLAWNILVPVGSRLPLTLLRTAPMRGRATMASMLKSKVSEQRLRRYLKLRERMRTPEARSRGY